MLKFLKNLFSKKEPEKINIKIEELDGWFSSESEKINQNLDIHIKEIKEKLNQEICSTKDNLEKLKKAKLRNPNIPTKAKDIMKGNRESYIKAISNFIENIRLPDKECSIKEYHKEFSSSIQALEKSTGRSYQVLKEFFANEATDIAINIKNIAGIIEEIENFIRNSGIDNIQDISESIRELNKDIKIKSQKEKDLSERESELSNERKKKLHYSKMIDDTKRSVEYRHFMNLKEKEGNILKEINRNKDLLIQSFSVLNKALKKFSKISFEDNKLIKQYIEDPVKALFSDSDLRITKILYRLKSSIDKLNLDNKKKLRTLKEINKLDNEFLLSLLKRHNSLNDQLMLVHEKIKENLTDRKIKDLEEHLEKNKENIRKLENYIESLKKDLDRYHIEENKKQIENKIKDVLKIDFTLS